jgi:hypothetical protein
VENFRGNDRENNFLNKCLITKFEIMKLSLDILKERIEAIASEELLETISGGIEDACHDDSNHKDLRLGDGNIPTDFNSK